MRVSCLCRVAIQDGQNYTWMEGPKYRASTDYDSKNVIMYGDHIHVCINYLTGNSTPRTGESTAHVCSKVYV